MSTEIKTNYWLRVGLDVREALRMHQISGNMEKDESGKRPWGNVTEHCLVQAARADTLSHWLGLPPDIAADVKTGSALHDFEKKQEITAIREADRHGESPSVAIERVTEGGKKILVEHGFSQRVIKLANVQGGSAYILYEMKNILDKPTLTDDDIATLICHYVDDISGGSDWVAPTTTLPDQKVNVVDARMATNKAKTVYIQRAQEVSRELEKYQFFKGMTSFDAMATVSHLIEQKLAEIIIQRTGEVVDPLLIPEIIDEKIRQSF